MLKKSDLDDSLELQPHQDRVLEKLKGSGSILLYHGLGSGKTLSSIAATEGMPTDVVVPASLRNNYHKEVDRFTDGRTRRNIMSYEAAAKGVKPAEALVVDEAHRLGNSSSKRSQALMDMAGRYRRRVLLTGTPIKNDPSELAPLIRMLDPSDKSIPLDPVEFNRRFTVPRRVVPGLWDRIVHGATSGEEREAGDLSPLARALRGHVDYHAPDKALFPDRRDVVVKTPMSEEQKGIYDTVMGRANPIMAWKIRSNFPLNKKEATQLNAFLTASRIASNAPSQFGGRDPAPKMLRAVDDFMTAYKKNPGHKGIVYSNYLDGGVNEYARLLEGRGVPYGVFHGGLSDKERKRLVEDYNSGRIRNLLLTGAGAEGLDLKGTRMVQLLEPHWNNPRLEQAAGRGIRLGSHSHLPEDQRNVEVRKYLSTLPEPGLLAKLMLARRGTSVDEYLDELGAKKERWNNQFLDLLKQEGSRPYGGDNA